MSNELTKLSPESLAVIETYIENEFDMSATAAALKKPKEEVASHIATRQAKKYLDTLFREYGYMNRFKLFNIMDRIIDKKLEEAEELDFYTNKDILDVLERLHKMRIEELKLIQKEDEDSSSSGNKTQVNVNNNWGDLMNQLLGPKQVN